MTDQEFKESVIAYMARHDEHMANQSKRCNSHAEDIVALQEDIKDLPKVKNDVWWIDRWLAASWAAILSVIGFLAYAGASGNKGGN